MTLESGRMRNILLAICLLLLGQYLPAQLNMSLVAEKQYSQELNDIWAWVAPDGTEYALVGTSRGLSIVSLANPAQPAEVAFVSGPTSIWRDIKTWGHYAYVSNETGSGLQVIDLEGLPASVRDTFWTVDYGGRTLSSIHNLYIDSVGYCYVAGSNLNRGGALILDVHSDPWNPELVGVGPGVYAHDIYVRGDLMYCSEIYEGEMAIFDISDKKDVLLLGTQNTPYNFTHNIWLSDNGKVAFTTDERFTAPVAAYDVSDPSDITELDQFRPAATLNEGSIPHNVHVWNDWLIISYYYDGGLIVDASRPQNLVEVGNFDTFFNLDPGDGAWGAYPFLPSGLVLVTDIGNGLFILQPNYVRAAWLEGKVTDGTSGAALNDVRVEIQSPQVNVDFSDLSGNYKTGQAIPGTFPVRFFKTGYLPVVKNAVLENGKLTILDVQLFKASQNQLSGITLQDEGGGVIEGAQVLLRGEQGEFQQLSDEDGIFQVQGVYQGTYELYVGKWGYLPKPLGEINLRKDTAITVRLQQGYQDDFFFDFGWQSTIVGDGSVGAWEMGEPVGTYRANGSPVAPDQDIAGDLGDQCYVTGNGGGDSGTDDVDDGIATLISPPMDLREYADPVLTYYAWFYNSGGSSPADDSLLIRITNGTDTVTLENIRYDMSAGSWRPEAFFHLKDILPLTESMQLILITGDLDPTGHLLEAALDVVRVREYALILDVDDPTTLAGLKVYPNPFREVFQLDLNKLEKPGELQLRVFNQIGQQVWQSVIPAGTGNFSVPGQDWTPGLYYVQVIAADRTFKTLKVLKVW